jgi:vacuolar-type H+-ATPase subunit I/STV1
MTLMPEGDFVMHLNCLLVLLIGVVLPVMGYAEFYRYTDDNGVIRYTDDLSTIPKKKRSQVKQFEEADDSLTPAQRNEKALKRDRKNASDSDQKNDQKDDWETLETDSVAELAKLNEKKAKLDKEYADLVKEKDALIKTKEKISGGAEIKANNEKIVDLNGRISGFEERRQDFSKDVDAFNARFKK